DHEALHLMEHRRVRHVGIAAIDAARNDHAHRWLLAFHHSHLHGRGMRAQQPPVRKIERVVHCPCGMIRRDIQRFEVVPVVFDLGAFGDLEPGASEDLFDPAAHARDRVQPADPLPPAWERDIHRIARELLRQGLLFEFRTLVLDRAEQLVLCFIDPCAGRTACFGIHAAERLEQRGDLALLTEQADTHLLELIDARAPRNVGARALDDGRQVYGGFGHDASVAANMRVDRLQPTGHSEKRGKQSSAGRRSILPVSCSLWRSERYAACFSRLSLAFCAITPKAAGSWKARSARTLRSIDIPAAFKPAMSLLYDKP